MDAFKYRETDPMFNPASSVLIERVDKQIIFGARNTHDCSGRGTPHSL